MFLLSLVFLFITKLQFPENKSIRNVVISQSQVGIGGQRYLPVTDIVTGLNIHILILKKMQIEIIIPVRIRTL